MVIFNEKLFPSRETFFRKLNNKEIVDKDYIHAQRIWNKFSINDTIEYQFLHKVIDALLLPGVFE